MPGSSSASARERLLAGIERVAMRAVDAPHAFFRKHAIELAAGAAIAIEAEDLVIGRAVGADLGPHRLGDAARDDCEACAGRQAMSIWSSLSASASRARRRKR